MKKAVEWVRINTRIRPDQMKFIKGYAEMKQMTEGETHRLILDYYMSVIAKPKGKTKE